MGDKYHWKVRPYKHQVAAVKDLLSRGWGGALLMEPRTGKTKTAIDWFSILHQKGEVNRVLIVCPVSVMGVWVDEIRAHCQFRRRIVVWDRTGRKSYNLPTFGHDVLDIVIVNYDAFSTVGTRRGRNTTGRYALRDALRAWQPQCMILDESHRIKTISAKKTQMIISVAWQDRRPRDKPSYKEELVPYRAILTGTVLTKKKRVFDIYSQWQFLNPNSPLVKEHTHASFKERYGRWTNRNGYPQWLRNQNEAELTRLLHEESFAVKRDECFDLPHKTEQVIHLGLQQSAPYYDEMAEEMVAKLKSGEISWAKIPLVQQLRLAQITSGIIKTEPTDEHAEGRLVRVGREKLEVLENLLADLFEAEEKVVIAARWRADIAAIAKLGAKLSVPIFQLHGGISSSRSGGKDSERDIAIKQFRELDGPGLFIMQPSAGSLGIDLRTASVMIWYSLTNSWVDFTQANDRIALSDRAISIMYLIARGTIDELMLESLREDGDMAARVTASPDRLLRNFKQ